MTGNTTNSFGIDTTVPTTARMYDYWLGGHDNFAANRKAALQVSEVAPEAPLMARENHGIAKLAFHGDLSLFISMKRAGLSAAASMIAKVFFPAVNNSSYRCIKRVIHSARPWCPDQGKPGAEAAGRIQRGLRKIPRPASRPQRE
jgi:hypothetical protein